MFCTATHIFVYQQFCISTVFYNYSSVYLQFCKSTVLYIYSSVYLQFSISIVLYICSSVYLQFRITKVFLQQLFFSGNRYYCTCMNSTNAFSHFLALVKFAITDSSKLWPSKFSNRIVIVAALASENKNAILKKFLFFWDLDWFYVTPFCLFCKINWC